MENKCEFCSNKLEITEDTVHSDKNNCDIKITLGWCEICHTQTIIKVK